MTVTVYLPSVASWYGPTLYGHGTACGEKLTRHILGVANKTLPCGEKVALYYHGRTLHRAGDRSRPVCQGPPLRPDLRDREGARNASAPASLRSGRFRSRPLPSQHPLAPLSSDPARALDPADRDRPALGARARRGRAAARADGRDRRRPRTACSPPTSAPPATCRRSRARRWTATRCWPARPAADCGSSASHAPALPSGQRAARDGEAIRVSTGAAMPAGADAVIPQEDIDLDGERE